MKLSIKGGKREKILIGCFIVLAFFLLIWGGFKEKERVKDLQENGVVAVAKVVNHSKKIMGNGESKNKRCCVELVYAGPAGDGIKGEECSSSMSVKDEYPIGKEVDVFYSSTNPSNFIIGSSAPDDDSSLLIFMFALFQPLLMIFVFKIFLKR